MSADQWYYEVNGQGYGPISGRELKQLADSGLIERTTLVRQGERGQWARAEKCRGLFAEAAEQEPPPVIKPAAPRAAAATTPLVAQQPPIAPQPQIAPRPAAPQFAPPPQQAVPEAQFVSFGDNPAGIVPKVSIAGAGSRSVPKTGAPKTPRGGKYDALIFVSNLYNVLAWVVLVLGGLGVAGYLAIAVIGAVNSGEAGSAVMVLAFAFGGAVMAALYVLLTFVTLRAASQAVLLAMDVEKHARRSNELLESIRDSLVGPR